MLVIIYVCMYVLLHHFKFVKNVFSKWIILYDFYLIYKQIYENSNHFTKFDYHFTNLYKNVLQ